MEFAKILGVYDFIVIQLSIQIHFVMHQEVMAMLYNIMKQKLVMQADPQLTRI